MRDSLQFDSPADRGYERSNAPVFDSDYPPWIDELERLVEN